MKNSNLISVKKLKINQICTKKSGRGYKLFCLVEREDKEVFELYFDYDITEKELLNDEFCDSFVVALLPYAMEFGYDIYCDNKISSEIFDELVNNYIPSLSKFNKSFKKINIYPPSIETKKITGNYGVATGCSCGVDSFHTIYLNDFVNGYVQKSNSLTHLVVVNSGACSWVGGEESSKWFNIEVLRGKKVASELGLSFISVDTNLMEFYRVDHSHSGFMRISGIILGMDKLIGKYYFASTYDIQRFDITRCDDDGYYLAYTVSSLSDKNLIFRVTNEFDDRYDKIKRIEDYKPALKYLNVCWDGGNNCGKCEKCLRTIGSLYSRGKLDNFAEVLNAKWFINHKTLGIAKIISYSKIHKEMYTYLNDLKKINCVRYFFSNIIAVHYIFKNHLKVLAKKVIKKDSFLYKKIKNRRKKN